MPLYWLCYRHNNQISVVIEPGASPIHARMRASLDELDEGDSPKATSLIASGDTEAACGRASCDYVFDSPEL